MSWLVLPLAIRVKRRGWPALWLPLIWLWPVILAMFCLALPLCVLLPAPRGSVFATLVATYHMLCALHGTDLEVTSTSSRGSAQTDWTLSLY